MPLTSYVKTTWVNDSAPAQDETNLNKQEDGIFDVTEATKVLENEVVDLKAPDSVTLTPQDPVPSHIEGQIYYDDVHSTFVGEGKFSDAPVRPGHSLHTHVINNTAAVIEKGMAVQHAGVTAGGIVQISKAIATSFVDARVFGVTQHSIGIGAEGAIVTGGEIYDVDTSGVTAGVPLYLSDTVAGTWTETAPNIVSQIGGATTSVLDGTLFVLLVNNTNLPTIYGGLQGKTVPLTPLTATPIDITGYITETENVVTVDATTGVITLPNAGAYRSNFAASISFTSATTTRSVAFEVYDVTGTAVAFTYTKNIPRDATEDSLSFSFPAQAVVNNQIKMRVSSVPNMSITFESIVFDIESVNITI